MSDNIVSSIAVLFSISMNSIKMFHVLKKAIQMKVFLNK